MTQLIHLGAGSWTSYFGRDHEITPPKAPPDICQWTQFSRRIVCQIRFYKGENSPPGCAQVQWRWWVAALSSVLWWSYERFKGHINHSLFWKNLAPASAEGGKLESGALKSALERDFGSVEAFKKTFNAKTAAIQGSGWGWLVCSLCCYRDVRELTLSWPGIQRRF